MVQPDRPRRLRAAAALAAAAVALAAPAAAHAVPFAGVVVDGPSADLRGAADVDVARDGTGVVAYVKADGGVDHVFASRLVDGAWTAPERLDAGLPAPGSQPAAAVADDGRATVLWTASGTIFAATRAAGATAWGRPQVIGPGTLPSVDMSIHGTAYATYTQDGDVHAARLGRTDTSWAALPGALDARPGQGAGFDVPRRSRVAASAEGSAIAVWGEDGTDGRIHVMARRITAAGPVSTVNDLTLDALDGRAAGDATEPDITIEDDGAFGWAVFTQAVNDEGGPHTRTIARRLRASRFEAPVAVDGLGTPSPDSAAGPRISINGRGEGVATTVRTGVHGAMADVLLGDAFGGAVRMDGGTSGGAVPAASQNGRFYGVWWQADGNVLVRDWNTSGLMTAPPFGDAAALSDPNLGPMDGSLGLDAAADRMGDLAAVFVQNGPGGPRLVVGGVDLPPGRFDLRTTLNWQDTTTPTLTWTPSTDLWGVTYRVSLDGKVIAPAVQGTTFTPTTPIADGAHTWAVTAVDRRGQEEDGGTRRLRVDTQPPTLRPRVPARTRVGALVSVRPGASVGPQGADLASVLIRWGDGTPAAPVTGATATHRYRVGGRRTIVLQATDEAGNTATVRTRISVAR